MSLGTTIVLIVLIATIGQVLKSFAGRGGKKHKMLADPEVPLLKAELQRMRERIAVLERIATDKNHPLELEFERLRDH